MATRRTPLGEITVLQDLYVKVFPRYAQNGFLASKVVSPTLQKSYNLEF